ncbi:CRISPR-associated protein Cst2 [Clostridium saccharoperbutylacetonicum]|uniref:CRISPR-associated regulatory protein Cst2 n=1 Tax=Clostridium saccharoperbutylacetonicum N1-4(HMT) TaxID=931276 RepID=M1N543_9CLOT|nr:type I-B CRISPR-associated protein Cas7/Cst2/DevR [Clostridium saccharoperbutylacetonicum]AGF58567.1 CRISPR-associated regulatory protein Cst2 [Clostridium saccharoperbutylacetonicum N1-4(HMT)]NRT60655.1 CRISPR-associated protein Cst2 [Clostridium saccharoperbutylacetonicum]NSB23969.1 CRISPR-associated protein Cst2 [Clostridium saccharoperbutylacetonicum]NSB43345.1 CRISPR-associated protein Cst2 [Clostridium saccharoperbutylacetonicum]
MGKSITCSIIFQGQSLNYGEGIGNISELKKLTRNDGNFYTLATRQALTYDVRRLGEEIFGWNLQTVDKSKGTIQFKNQYTIKDSEEMDLFGYMKTAKKEGDEKGGSAIRPAVARVSTAISLEPYKSDMDFLSNKGFADRIGEHPNLANSEQHLSYYTYTLTIDLDKVGVDGDLNLDNSEKAKRVNQLLDLVKILNRNIRGRQENLSPLFIIGGTYDIANPFFMGRIELEINKGKFNIKTKPLEDALDMTILECNVKDNTNIGVVSGVFGNEEELDKLVKEGVSNIESFFKQLKNKVNAYYGV